MSKLVKEIWRTAVYQGIEYKNFSVSSLGRITKTKKGATKFIATDMTKRRTVSINNGRGTTVNVAAARLIYCTFGNGYIRKGYVIDHVDNNCCNDKICNLQEITNAENISKYHKWNKRRALDIRNNPPKERLLLAKPVPLGTNNLYNHTTCYLGLYPNQRMADEARRIAKGIISIYKIKNNDKIKKAVREAVNEYRAKNNLPLIIKYSCSTTKHIMRHINRYHGIYKLVY